MEMALIVFIFSPSGGESISSDTWTYSTIPNDVGNTNYTKVSYDFPNCPKTYEMV